MGLGLQVSGIAADILLKSGFWASVAGDQTASGLGLMS